MKYILMGTDNFTINAANAIIDTDNEICAMISMPLKFRPNNFVSIDSYAKKNKINYHEIKNINSKKSHSLLKSYNADFFFISWPKIINKNIVNIPKYCSIGTHPTDLPYNRGRHPLHWMITLGINKTKLSFFKMDTDIDSGDILLQKKFTINERDTINHFNKKLDIAAYQGTLQLTEKLSINPRYEGEKQYNKDANYWRKRTFYDVTIDLRMSAKTIIRIIRSFTLPYPCANLIFRNKILKIKKAVIVKTDLNCDEIKRIEPGKIIKIKKSDLTVKVEDEILKLYIINPIPKEIKTVKYIHPPSTYFHKYQISFDK